MMSYFVCLKINARPQESTTQIVQLDRSKVNVLGELKDVLIRLASQPKVFQIIDIVIANISESYGLSTDRSMKLKCYFSIDWSHLWLPFNGKPNKIREDHEYHMKHIIIDINE